jgi:co-chaperonin GroES (HSP10)
MATAYDVKHVKLRALHDWVIVCDMDFGEMVTSGGIVVQSDNAKAHGIKPRWAKVYCIGPDQTDVKVGDWILVEHGRWTRAMHINDGERELKAHRVDVNAIMAVSNEKPNDFYINSEVSHGDSFTIRPEEFGAR